MTKFDVKKLKISIDDKFVYFCAYTLLVIFLTVFIKKLFLPLYRDLQILSAEETALKKILFDRRANWEDLDTNLRLAEEFRESGNPRLVELREETKALLYIAEQIEESPLTKIEFKLYPREDESDLALRPLRIAAHGTFEDCMEFLRLIQRGKYYFMPYKTELKLLEPQQETQEEERFEMLLDLYLLSDDTESADD